MLLRVVLIASSIVRMTSFLYIEILLGCSGDRAVLGSMMIELHPHALKLTGLLREPVLLLLEFIMTLFPLVLGRPCRCVFRSCLLPISILMGRLTVEVEGRHCELLLLTSDCKREGFLIEVYLILQMIYLVSCLLKVIVRIL